MTDPGALLRTRFEERAADRLREAGFDMLAPDPRLAWTALALNGWTREGFSD